MIEKLESLLQWSEPAEVPGEGFIYHAEPNSEFWNLWRADKMALREAGIRVAPGANRSWNVSWIRPSVIAAVAPATEVVYPTLVEQEESLAEFVLPAGITLSSEQDAIILWYRSGPNSGNLVIIARAGSGKTFTSILGFANAPEKNQLYAVFNKKNQREAAAKITDKRVTVLTLHALGNRYIKRVWPLSKPDDSVEFDRVESVIGSDVDSEIFNAVLKLVGFAKNVFCGVPTHGQMVELCEDRDIDAGQYSEVWNSAKLASAAIRVLEASKIQDKQNRISFNDMVWLPVAMKWVRAWYDLVTIDEAQDMNAPQLAMARGASKGRICVVGDDRQAIYGFRGAVSNGLAMMKSELNAKTLTLTITRRCPKAVVALAAAYVPDYKAADDAPEGIVSSVAYDNIFKTVKVGDAILSRINAPLMSLCLGLIRKGIAARIEGRDIGKMLLNIIEKLNAKSVPNFIERVIALGDRAKVRAAKLKNAESRMSAIDDQTATLIALAEDAKNVDEIKLRCATLFADSDNNPKPAVILSSTHKAKGLEWDRVFVLRDTYLKRSDLEEENLFYVAITRTKAELVFVEGEAKSE